MNLRVIPLLLLSSSFAFAHTPVSMDPPADLGPVKFLQSDKSQGFCAINMQDKVVCWGDAAQPPADLPAVKSLSVHYDHGCAIDFQNLLHCWGPDYESTLVYLEVPEGVTTVQRVGSNWYNDCAVLMDGTVICWNEFNEPISVPSELSSPVSLVPYGNGTCALGADHKIRCFNYNQYDDSYEVVPPSMDVAKFEFDDGNTGCALGMDGQVICFGEDNENNETVPTDLGPVKDLSVGRGEACVIRQDDTIRCWKVWGAGTIPTVGTPITDPVIAVTTGYMAGCGVLADHTVKCWNDYDPDGKAKARRVR